MKIQNLPPAVAALNPLLKTKKSSTKKRLAETRFSSHIRKLEGIPPDLEQIEAIKNAIKSGEFQVNIDAIADALIESARELLKNR